MSRASTDAPVPESGDAETDVARWLVEAGRRKRPGRAATAAAAAFPPAAIPAGEEEAVFHRVVLLGALAAALFQYFYLDVLLQVASLRSLIVFVIGASHG